MLLDGCLSVSIGFVVVYCQDMQCTVMELFGLEYGKFVAACLFDDVIWPFLACPA